MITEKLIFKVPYFIPDVQSWSDIFGANLYDWWDFTDSATISETTGLINSITSKGTNAAVMTSSGSNRPSLVTSSILGSTVGQFDGVSEWMGVNASTAMYNFLHNAAGTGTVIMIGNVTSDTGATQYLIGNNGSGTPQIGYLLATGGTLKTLSNLTATGSAGNRAINNNSNPTAMYSDFTSVNMFMDLVDANNGTAAERSRISSNFGSEIKNNTQTNAPTNSNASYVFQICKSASALANYAAFDISEIVILDTIPTPTQLTQIQTKLEADYGTFPIS